MIPSKKIENSEEALHIFNRPKQVSEEEVSISKEKKVCVVCKKELSRKNYICPKCKTFYCVKCADTLATIENECWVCYTPFDEALPVKSYKLEEDLPEIEENRKKN